MPSPATIRVLRKLNAAVIGRLLMKLLMNPRNRERFGGCGGGPTTAVVGRRRAARVAAVLATADKRPAAAVDPATAVEPLGVLRAIAAGDWTRTIGYPERTVATAVSQEPTTMVVDSPQLHEAERQLHDEWRRPGWAAGCRWSPHAEHLISRPPVADAPVRRDWSDRTSCQTPLPRSKRRKTSLHCSKHDRIPFPDQKRSKPRRWLAPSPGASRGKPS
jgi:hypothetical protein